MKNKLKKVLLALTLVAGLAYGVNSLDKGTQNLAGPGDSWILTASGTIQPMGPGDSW